MWVANKFDHYVNLDHVVRHETIEDPPGSGNFRIAFVDVTGAQHLMKGTYPTGAAANEAARELVDGVDPSTYGD